MNINYIIGATFALFAFIFFVIFIYFGIKSLFKDRNLSKDFVFLQRVGKCILFYSKKTKKIYFVTKNGYMFNTFEKYGDDINEKEKE